MDLFTQIYCKSHLAKRFFLMALLFSSCAMMGYSQNAIVIENSQTGNPPSEWQITGAGALSIQGFATTISVNKGDTVHFKIKTDASAYTINVYRIGYYQGNGARLIGTGLVTCALPQSQPTDLYDAVTGKTDCSNWQESGYWKVPSNAVSGVYMAKLTRLDNSGASHITFIVRDDVGNSNLLFKTGDATWQAYNNYGGNSLYVAGISVPGFNHATKISYQRPFYTANGGGGGGPDEDWFFNAEYPMIRFLEKNGYNISYSTDWDMGRDSSLITPAKHKVMLSVGHDEYWSAPERKKFEDARDAGVHLAFFSGNEVYWKTRWEDNNQTIVCYKEGTLGENICGGKCDPLLDVWTGLWRDGCSFVAADGCNPENSISGEMSWDGSTGSIEVPYTYRNMRFWRNTSIASLADGQTATLPYGTLGYEWDWEQYEASYPAGRITMSSTAVGGRTHKLSVYRHSSGALVFGAGTIQWSWGLDSIHARGNEPADIRMQQATVNILGDMGVQPETLQSDLVSASASTDFTAPTSIITTPLNGALLPQGTAVNISGTASDIGGAVAGVEVSVDGGATWQMAEGTTNWNYFWVPTVQGTVTIKSRAFDDSGNIETEGNAPSANAIIDTVGDQVPVVCPCTIFQPTDAPVVANGNDGQAIELGVKFKSSQNGYITGIRFYKGAGTTGTHIGHLWNTSGDMLAEATFTGESSSGWQEVLLGAPIAIDSGITYVASFHSSSGDYPYTNPYFTQPVFNGPLKALADGEAGHNGVYKYSAISAYPDDNYKTSNYWVDVVFNTYVGPDVTSPGVASTSPSNGATGVQINTTVKAVFTEAIDTGTINASTFELRDSSNVVVLATVSYNTGSRTVTLTPSANLDYTSVYTATLKGGIIEPTIRDLAGNPLAANYSWSFTTRTPPPPPPNEGTGGPVLVISAASNPFSRYPVEILRAEGWNAFTAMDISLVSASVLNDYDVVVLGEIPLSASDVTMLTNWVNAGGTLIAFRPDAQLAPLMGITPAGGTLSDKYLLVNNSGPGVGIVNQTIQYHGVADQYALNGATSLATLYSDASTATTYPAVTTKSVGSNGGIAVAFTYDLAKSVVYTRQGNPEWADQKRDGEINPIRSDDQFFPDWIDFNKIAIPQADEQQHLLSNIIVQGNLHRKPLPRTWFLPKGLKAAVVMTGDDHGDSGMQPRFDINIAESPSGCSLEDWECIRSTGYLFVGSNFTSAQATQYNNLGFEVALHINTGCANFNESQFQNFITNQFDDFQNAFPGVPLPATNRNHCIAWSGWSMTPEVQAANGIRLDVNYYYWPPAWVNDRPGMFTGSGMPMRFAKLDGTIIDCYQATTQMTDESGQSYPTFINALLDKAIGTEGYYGVFTANMHFDNPNHPSANAIVASAKARGIPVVSAKQMLDWLDGRNSSAFNGIAWNNQQLSFSITAATGSRNMQAMLPTACANGTLNSISYNGSPLSYNVETIKGISYAFFDATKGAGTYMADYSVDTTGPVISNIVASPHSDGTATITWTTDEISNSSVHYAATPDALALITQNASMVSSHSVVLSGLSQGVTYNFRVTSADAADNSSTSPMPSDSIAFSMPFGPCVVDQTDEDFNLGMTDANTVVVLNNDGEVILKPTLQEEFSGGSIPSGWSEDIWDGQPGASTSYSGGQVTVNGTHIYTNAVFGPGTSVEFKATFSAGNFQNVGFTADAGFNNPWIVIGRGGAGDGNIYARTFTNQTADLGGNLLGTPHIYKIKWNSGSNNFEFYVDGSLVSTPSITEAVGSNMNVQISDYPSGGDALTVDWIRITPYTLSGSFTSNVFDGGSMKEWDAATWDADVPLGTGISVYARKGNTSVPDGSWTSFIQIPSSGSNVGGASRYIQYRTDLSTGNNSVTPVLKSISIECEDGVGDVSPPVITNIVVTPSSDGISVTITWTTDEPSDSKVNYDTVSNPLNQSESDASAVTIHSVTINGLIPGTTYYFDVSSEDLSGNSSTEPFSARSFDTPLPFVACFTDNAFSDFSSGNTGGNTYVSLTNDGEVILNPSLGAEFSGAVVPSGWGEEVWDGQGGATTSYNSGRVAVSGTHVYTNTSFGPGASLEFIATYTVGNFQNIGFTGDAAFNDPWIVIGRGGAGDNNVYVRTSAGQTSVLGGSLLDAPHRYKIKWNSGSDDFEFYVDEVLVPTPSITQTVSSNMIVQISDYPAGGVELSVDWLRIAPYSTSGTFESRVYDGGAAKNWGDASWTTDMPVGTSLSVYVRTGEVAIPDGSWTAYSLIAVSGDSVGGVSRYAQYKVDLTTSNNQVTPVFKDFEITCSDNSNVAPEIMSSPSSVTACEGTIVVFVSDAGGNPSPTVQWQESTDNGDNWNDITNAISDTLQFEAAPSDNGKLFHAVWINAYGIAISDSAILLVNSIPSATISALNANACQGDSIHIQLSSGGSNQPYDIVVNGIGYMGIQSGQTFASFGPIEQSIWGSTGTPSNSSVTDNVPIEVGVKFNSSVSGFIRGVRFYKGETNTGIHVGSLWNTSGAKLASDTFTIETASGWQEVHFSNPVAIQADTTYIASYFSQDGYFAISPGFFSGSGVANPPLTALLAGGVDGPNGVYKYGGGFPDGGNNANYWVDVLFEETYATPQTFTYNLTSVVDTNGCTASDSPLSSTSVVVHPLPLGVLLAPENICEGDSILLTYTETSGTGPYTLVINGTPYNNVNSGVPFNSGFLPAAGLGPISIWDSGTIGGEPGGPDPSDIELGVKFRSNISGQISGIRFYKRATNTGTHTGTLWSSSGTQLVSAVFADETASGWQQVDFSSPVTIAANTTYIAAPSITTEFLTSCNPADTGVLELHLTNIYGCDSTHTITTSLLLSSETSELLSSCNPADTGVVVLHFTNQYGCDSMHTVTTTILPISSTTEFLTSCNPADTGVVILHFTSQYGCDSTHTVTTTLLPSSATTEFLTSCNPTDTGWWNYISPIPMAVIRSIPLLRPYCHHQRRANY
ncbi:MAG: DUF4082 domain-containing protein [Bacteroidetes bacterium]|nr:DUF4082 domain-containing protein [Bacteroidota bacterium]